jgi:hypothetical protein
MSTPALGDSGVAVSTKKHPVKEIKRTPVSQEDLAVLLGSKVPLSTWTEECCLNALYESVFRLVRQQASRYAVTCPHTDVDDMVNNCWYRIIKKLHLFKPHKGKFTTWCSHVARSVLDKNYQKGRRWAARTAEMPEGLDESRVADEDTRSLALCFDVRAAIAQLRVAHGDYGDIIDAMFIDADGDFNPNIVFRDVADRSGRSPAKVSHFYHNVVKPFFIERFKGDMDNE